MSDDFKEKLEAYEKGELSQQELEEFEKELAKLEEYQQYLSEPDGQEEVILFTDEKQRKLMRRGKWKARISTAFYAVMVFIIFTFVTSILTAIYYQWGNPDRGEVYRDVIDHTLTVTNPYGSGGGGGGVGAYFTMDNKRDLIKVVGKDSMKVGELNTKFFFSLMAEPEITEFDTGSNFRASFLSPELEEDPIQWQQLEKLPEGTVVSAYVSFAESLETGEVLQLLDGKEIDLLWLALETGNDWKWDVAEEPIGFPPYPIWHDDDMILTDRTEEKGWFFGKVVSEGYHSPEYEEGDPKILHDQFMKTLQFLKKYERKANKVKFYGKLNLAEKINYLEKNGYYHYGIVITGPTKEVLTLKDEEWAKHITIDEVALWNWYSYE